MLTNEENTKLGSMLDKLGLEYGFIDSGLDGEEIVRRFEAELEKGRREGYTPVLVIEDQTLCMQFEAMLNNGYSVKEELKKEPIDAKAFLEQRISWLESMGFSFDDSTELGISFSNNNEKFGGVEAAGMFADSPVRIALVKLPTDKPWEAAIYIPFGGWNECPSPLEMASVLKLWYEKYGAVPAVITSDTLDMFVSTPVSAESANELVREQFAFDMDIAMQGVSLKDYTKMLTNSRIWTFWWD